MDELISLGLDLGSSTTKLVVCRLGVEDVAGFGGLPRVAVTRRDVLHASALHRTPLRPEDPDLIDVDAALLAVSAWEGSGLVACAIVKHTTPCGIAVGADPAEAYRKALATDPTSAFGCVIAFNV
jgi:AICAR transformylase/IMP cyclohydrolase PurH